MFLSDLFRCSTHRGGHINIVLRVVHDSEDVAARGCNAQLPISAVDVGSSICRCGRRFQHEGGKVEQQRKEMVKHVLTKKGDKDGEKNTQIQSR